MAIHERLYSRLAAPPRSRSTFPALAISRYGTRYATRGVFRKLVLFGSFAPAVIMSFGLYFVAQNEESVLRFVAPDPRQQLQRCIDEVLPAFKM